MTYQQIKSFINTYIVQNGVKALTGAQLNTALNALADYYGFDAVTVETLPAGTDATVNIEGRTLHLGIPRGVDGIDGIDGIDGQNAVNPFKGWFTTDNIPTTGQAGDYCNVSNTSVTPHTVTIYRWSTANNRFEDTGEVPDTANGETFASSETLQEVAIDDSHLVNPVNTANATQPVLADARDVAPIKKKLETLTQDWVDLDITNYSLIFSKKYLDCRTSTTGTPKVSSSSSEDSKILIIDVEGYKKVKFLGRLYPSSATPLSGWAFYDATNYAPESSSPNLNGFLNDNTGYIEGAFSAYEKGTSTEDGTKEYEVTVPANAKYLKVQCSMQNSALTLSNFYFKYSGDTIKNMVEDAEFATSEKLKDVYIDDTNLENPNPNSLTKAIDAKQIKDRLNGLFVDWVDVVIDGNQNIFSKRYVNCVSNDSPKVALAQSPDSKIIIIDVEGFKQVQFKAIKYKSTGTAPSGWAFFTAQNYDQDTELDNDNGFIRSNVGYIENGWAAFERNDTSEPSFHVYELDIPQNAKYLKITCSLSSGDLTLNDFYCKLRGESIYSIVDEAFDEAFDEALVNVPLLSNDTLINKNIGHSDIYLKESPVLLMTGASFADKRNQWFEMACQNLNATCVNKAHAGDSVTNSANYAYEGTLWSFNSSDTNYIDNIDCLVIMHVLNYDVNNDTLIKNTVAEYEANPYRESQLFYVDPDTTHDDRSDATISRSYDYLIKKWRDDCYNRKNVVDSVYYGLPCGKPCQIVLCTSWHDGRSKFNNSIRKFAANWGLPLVQFDANIGFTKNKPMSDGTQVSVLYGNETSGTEVIGGVTYGWHMAFNNPTNESMVGHNYPYPEDNYIQRKMATIFANYMK